MLFLTYQLSKIFKKTFFWGKPSSIAIEPTTSCNLRCPECPSGLRSFSRPTGMLQDQLFLKIIDELSEHLTSLTFYFQGEPFLNPRFLEHVKYANTKKIYTTTSTNAHYLSPEIARKTVLSGLDRLIISIDGTSQDTYESYRVGGDLNKVLEGTQNIIDAKKELKSSSPYIIFQFLVVRTNEHQIEEVHNLAKKYGVNEVRLKTAQIYNFENGSDLIPIREKYSRYKKTIGNRYVIKNKLENSCWKMWHSAVITWDGKIVPCCFDKDAKHELGTVDHNNSFLEHWKNKKYHHFRSKVLNSRSNIDICQNCTEGTKVFSE